MEATAQKMQPAIVDLLRCSPLTQTREVALRTGPSGLIQSKIFMFPRKLFGNQRTGERYIQILVMYVSNLLVSRK